jgi:hypothetical protein
MLSFFSRALWGTVCLLSFLSAGAYAGPAVTVVSPSDPYPGTPYTLGFQFSGVSSDTITALGVYDDGQDGISSPASVGLWDTVGNLLRSAVVPSGTAAPLIGYFRYADIAPFTAVVGMNYIVGSYLAIDNATSINTDQGGSGFYDANVIAIEDRNSDFTGMFSFPDITDGFPAGAWLGGNVLFGVAAIPEPSTLGLLVAGLVGVAMFRRRRA